MFNDKKVWLGAYVALVQCLMQQMRNRAIILAVLLTATPTLAAEQCVEVKEDPNSDAPPTYAKYADTLTCYLRVDGHILVNGRCRVGISGDTGLWTMGLRLGGGSLEEGTAGPPVLCPRKEARQVGQLWPSGSREPMLSQHPVANVLCEAVSDLRS